MLNAGLVDEVSLLIAPVLDATIGAPASFDRPARQAPHGLRLLSADRCEADLLWLRYALAQENT